MNRVQSTEGKGLRERGARLPLFTIHCSLLIVVCSLLLVPCSPVSALDFSFRPKAFLAIPAGDGNLAADGNKRYSMGGGGDIGFEVDLSTIWSNPLGLGYTAGAEGGLLINPLRGSEAMNVSFYSIGGVAGVYYFPLSRLFTRLDGTVGVYQSANERGNSEPGFFWRAGGEAGFRLTPGFLVAANAGWRRFHYGKGVVLNSGIYAGLTAQMTFQVGRGSRDSLGVTLDQHDAVYPAFIQKYQDNAIGTVVIRNDENAEIRDLRLYFRAGEYTSSEFLCGTVSIIPRKRSIELQLLADFSPDILRFTDTGRILGEIVIRYRFLGQEREAVRAVTVATHNRNKITTGDASVLAAFISPTSPETLDFARFIAGLERSNRRTGHNQVMQYAMWLLEGLRASNVRLGETYTDESEAQFPAETLLYRTGSSRDLALLFASGLEGVGIRSAFVQTEDDFLVAVSLGINQAAAETLFNGLEKILVIDDYVWLPLSMKAFNEGFFAVWMQGAAALKDAFSAEKTADFVIVEEAWSIFPPAPLPELGRNVVQTDNAVLTREVNRAMQQFVEREISEIVRQIRSQINTNQTAALYNRLGIVQVRAGNTGEAKTAYERAAGMGSVPAMTNRGNLAMIERDYSTAERWFRQALQQDSQNSAALRGLELIAERR